MTLRTRVPMLALAFVGVLGIVGLLAPGAIAQNGRISAKGPFYVSGEAQKSGTMLSYPLGEEVACRHSHQRWEKPGGGPAQKPSSVFTVAPTFSGCSAGRGLYRATVSMNGCDFLFRIGETVNVREYELNAGLSCPVGGYGLIHVYIDSEVGSFLACTVHLSSRPKITGAKLLYQGRGRALLEGTMTGMRDSESGLCGFSSSPTVRYWVSIELSGVDPSGAPAETRLDD